MNDNIRPCTGVGCISEYQDTRYKGKRVKTPTNKGYRRTVCGTEETVIKDIKAKKEK